MFGVALNGRGPLAKPDLLLKIAERADALRFTSLFVTDHVVLPASAARSVYPYAPSGQFPGGMNQEYLEPLTLMGHLAHATRRVKLGTSVLVVPYRNPLLAAKMLATIDRLSGGRVILGAGVGWLREEFEALGTPPFADRGPVTDEFLRLMRECWSKAPVSFEGRHYSVREVFVLPQPVQKGGIPIWIGGHTDSALRRAGQLGDGWHPIGLRPPANLLPKEYAEKVERLHAHARAAGRDPASITLTFRAPMQVVSGRGRAAPDGERPMFQGTASQVIGDIRQYRALGVRHFVFDIVATDVRTALTILDRFATDVRPKIK
jgi:probable F420-dependent oxidoreductase